MSEIQAEINAAKERLFDWLNPGPGLMRDEYHLRMAEIVRREIKELQSKSRAAIAKAKGEA